MSLRFVFRERQDKPPALYVPDLVAFRKALNVVTAAPDIETGGGPWVLTPDHHRDLVSLMVASTDKDMAGAFGELAKRLRTGQTLDVSLE